MLRILKILSLFLWFLALPLMAKPKAKPAPKPKKPTVDEIIRHFTFIGDFELKEDTREVSKHEIFWRYPTKLPRVGFELDLEKNLDSDSFKSDFPQTSGEGRAYEHLNAGRLLFLKGEFDEARKIWLGARARYGKDFDYHRRNDYFIASSFLYLAHAKWLELGRRYDDADLQQHFSNASTFLSWAYDRKKDLPDPVLDRVAPRAYFNQSVLYYNYDRWAALTGSVNLGLDFLRKTGRSEYRRPLRRMLAEAYIRDRNYLEALREFDITLRQDEDKASSAAIFARIGDIYFDLNNFELAEEVYEAANRIDIDLKQLQPSQFILRGESLFWMGRFEDARKHLKYGLQSMSLPRAREVPELDMQAMASLRIADSWLAERSMEEAKLAYFSHIQEFKGHITEKYARIRLACLELPYYDGNNIRHARELLEGLKTEGDTLPSVAQELAWTCETASYAQHERNKDMVERVRRFAQIYPESGLLKSLVEPVRDVQAVAIESFFEANDPYGAVQFFEKTKPFLFPKVSPELGRKLFVAYVDIHQSEKSEAFLPDFAAAKPDASGLLRMAVAQAEIGHAAQGKARETWLKKNRAFGEKLLKDKTQFDPVPAVRLSVRRILDTAMASAYTPWLLVEALRWTDKDITVACDVVYPIMQHFSAQNGQIPADISKVADDFIESHLKDLLRFEPNCAQSLMEFEIANSPRPKGELVDRYLARTYLQMNPLTASILWNLAEQAFKAKDRASAEKLWRLLVEKGEGSLPEVRFAKARLNTDKTELEGLWDQ